MKFLTEDQIINEVSKVKNGCVARIGYISELPVAAAFKKQGIEISKLAATTGRLGVTYSNIKSVKERLADNSARPATYNYKWVIKNKVKYNTSTQKNYLQVARFNKGSHTKSQYIVKDRDKTILFDSLQELQNSFYGNCIIKSYFNKREGIPNEIFCVSFDNIFQINKMIAH